MAREKKCPLNCPEWVHFLAIETTLKRHDYYNEDLSLLTKIILVLTMINGLFVFISIANSFDYVPSDVILILAVISGIIFVTVIGYLKRGLNNLKEKKQYMDGTIGALSNIICDILKGELKDTNIIRKEYMDIWDKEHWKKY